MWMSEMSAVACAAHRVNSRSLFELAEIFANHNGVDLTSAMDLLVVRLGVGNVVL